MPTQVGVSAVSEPRILFLVQGYPPVFGGGALTLSLIRSSIARRGVESMVLTGNRGIEGGRQPGVCRLPSLGSEAYPRIDAFLFALMVVPMLVALHRRYDVIHTMGKEWSVYVAILVGRVLGKPVIVSSVQNRCDDPAGILRERFGRAKNAIFARASRYSCLSSLQLEAYRKAAYPDDKVRFIPNGMDPSRFRPCESPGARAALRERLGLPREGFLTVSVGAIVYRKGIDLLAEAWTNFQRAGGRGTLVLVGPDRASEPGGGVDDAFVASIRERLASAALAESVVFAGRVANVQDYLRAADVFALVSRGEGGVPQALLEAMATQLPFLVWDLPDYRGYDLKDGIHGHLVPPFDTTRLAERLGALASSVELREKMGRAARAHASEFTFDRNAASHMALYREVAAGRRTGGERPAVQGS